MEFFALLAAFFLAAFPLPDFTLSDKTREWARKLATNAATVTAKTANKIDDALVADLSAVVANDEAWSATYSVLADLINHDSAARELVSTDPRIMSAATKAGVSPINLVNLVLWLYEMYKSWKDKTTDEAH